MTFDPTITGLNTTLSINTVEAGAGAQLDSGAGCQPGRDAF
jgi:hypothetical protein